MQQCREYIADHSHAQQPLTEYNETLILHAFWLLFLKEETSFLYKIINNKYTKCIGKRPG